MLPRRRIFRPAQSPRRLHGLLVVIGLAAIGTLLFGVGLPGNLLGSAPREQSWSAVPADVRVLDGETLRLGDRTLRLRGLDAPDRGESCRTAGGAGFDCAAASADALARLIAGRTLTCEVQGSDSFGRGLGRCAAGGVDVNLAMVAAGFAVAAPGARGTLTAAEQEARTAGRGLWTSGTPETWRSRR